MERVDVAAVAAALRSMSAGIENPCLFEVARNLGVTAVINDGCMDRPGRTMWLPPGPEIRLQGNQSSVRRRFTLAHELAHVYLGHGRDNILPDGVRRNFRYEEHVADAVAGLLLVPDAEVQNLRFADQVSLADVRTTAGRLGVSKAVLVRRLADFDHTRHWLLLNLRRVKRDQAPWVVWDVTGRVRGLDSKMDLAATEHAMLDRLPDTDVRVRLRANVGGVMCELHGTGNRWKDLTMVLVSRVRSLRQDTAPADPTRSVT